MTPEVVTFGCRLNAVESDAILDLLAGRGDGLAVVNTCAVTGEAVRQARQAIRRLKRERPDRPVAVTGCGPEVDGSFAAMPEVAAVVPNRAKTDRAAWDALLPPGGTAPPSPAAERRRSRTRGFLEVQNGCDHRCTFCVIPFGRGASRSVPPEVVADRARALVEAGAREIVLTGVDLTAYGADLPGRPTLGRLARALLRALPDLPRLRLSSIDCVEADPDLVEAVGTEPRLMPHLHLSLQSGADLILKRMKRRHTRADAVAFCRAVRARRPDVVFGADAIVGFPTETEAHFAGTLALVAECGLTHLHVFPYSPRPGTAAARMPPVPPDLARERADRLRAEGCAALARHLAAQVGRELTVLTERGGRGRAEDFTPVRIAGAPAAGQLVAVRVTGHDTRDLLGSLAPGAGSLSET